MTKCEILLRICMFVSQQQRQQKQLLFFFFFTINETISILQNEKCSDRMIWTEVARGLDEHLDHF